MKDDPGSLTPSWGWTYPFDICPGTAYLSEHSMKRYIFSLLLGSYYVGWSVFPVSADWEFTKWGMSPEQVVQASNGQAHPHKEVDTEVEEPLLGQNWQSGPFLFSVWYFFSDGGKSLNQIQLKLKNTRLTYEVLTDLKAKYGTPKRETKEDPMFSALWQYSSDQILYSRIAETE